MDVVLGVDLDPHGQMGGFKHAFQLGSAKLGGKEFWHASECTRLHHSGYVAFPQTHISSDDYRHIRQ